MRVVGVIPSRYASTRLPAKPLIAIAGKPLLQWVIEGAKTSQKIDKLIVATDHPEIASLAQELGVHVAMTEPELPSGSDRVYAAVLNEEADVVLNIQGDEPLVQGSMLDDLVQPFVNEPDLAMATLAVELEPEALGERNVVKIVLNRNHEALYFSRYPIPYSRLDAEQVPGACLKHLGLYAYRKDFLAEFCQQPPIAIEKAESLEQLRALYLGAKIKVVQVQHDSWGVDTPEDVKRIEKILSLKGSHGAEKDVSKIKNKSE